jgi:uncharacterized membrane protein
MNVYLFILSRIVHIFAGVLWGGAAILYLFFVEPAAKSSGEAGHRFIGNLTGKHRYPQFMGIVSLVTILSGVPLYLFDSGGLQVRWILSGTGMVYTVGAVITVAVFILGVTQLSPRGGRLASLGHEIESAGGPPNGAQLAELEKLDREMGFFERWDVALVAIVLLTMATARIWFF